MIVLERLDPSELGPTFSRLEPQIFFSGDAEFKAKPRMSRDRVSLLDFFFFSYSFFCALAKEGRPELLLGDSLMCRIIRCSASQPLTHTNCQLLYKNGLPTPGTKSIAQLMTLPRLK